MTKRKMIGAAVAVAAVAVVASVIAIAAADSNSEARTPAKADTTTTATVQPTITSRAPASTTTPLSGPFDPIAGIPRRVFRAASGEAGYAAVGWIPAGSTWVAYSSPDAVTWTRIDHDKYAPGMAPARVVNIDGTLLMWGTDEAGLVMLTSRDGADWQRIPVAPAPFDATPNDIARHDGVYVAATLAGPYTSPDLVTWTHVDVPFANTTRDLVVDIEAVGAGFVVTTIVTDEHGEDVGVIWTSPDGVTWTSHDGDVPHGGTMLALDDGRLIVLDDHVYMGKKVTRWETYDGLTWNASDASFEGDVGATELYTMFEANGELVGVGTLDGGSDWFTNWTSTDEGLTWSRL